MAYSWTRVRRLIAQQTGLLHTSGVYTQAQHDYLDTPVAEGYGEGRLNGHYILLTDSTTPQANPDLLIRRHRGSDLEFIPAFPTNAVPNGSMFEVLPFAPTEILRSAQYAATVAYDAGTIRREHWMRMVGESPIYNADFGVWRSTRPDGWSLSAGASAEQRIGGADIGISETTLRLTNGRCFLSPTWQRFLAPLQNEYIYLHAWVRATTADAGIRIRISDTESAESYHTGGGAWELLSVAIQTDEDNPLLQPEMLAGSVFADFNMPFFSESYEHVFEYPFPIGIMPNGPTQVTMGWINPFRDDIGGLSKTPIGRQKVVNPPRLLTAQHPGVEDKYGILDWSLSRYAPREEFVLTVRGDSPITVPTTVTSSAIMEVTDEEALILASIAAKYLLERASAGLSPSVVRPYKERAAELDDIIARLSVGAGNPRNVATYGLGW